MINEATTPNPKPLNFLSPIDPISPLSPKPTKEALRCRAQLYEPSDGLVIAAAEVAQLLQGPIGPQPGFGLRGV